MRETQCSQMDVPLSPYQTTDSARFENTTRVSSSILFNMFGEQQG